jgi:hypothetical protein
VDNTIERKILALGVLAVERSTGSKAPKSLPDWTITSYDIDIDVSQNLGSGGFGNVAKGIWNGAIVAVKQMTAETPEKVCSGDMIILA